MTKISIQPMAQLRLWRLVTQASVIIFLAFAGIACSRSIRPDPTIPIPALAERIDRSPNTPNIVRFTTKSTPNQVLNWYKQEMVAQGWKVYIEARSTLPAVISFTSEGYRILFVLDVVAELQPNGITTVQVELKPQLAA